MLSLIPKEEGPGVKSLPDTMVILLRLKGTSFTTLVKRTLSLVSRTSMVISILSSSSSALARSGQLLTLIVLPKAAEGELVCQKPVLLVASQVV